MKATNKKETLSKRDKFLLVIFALTIAIFFISSSSIVRSTDLASQVILEVPLWFWVSFISLATAVICMISTVLSCLSLTKDDVSHL